MCLSTAKRWQKAKWWLSTNTSVFVLLRLSIPPTACEPTDDNLDAQNGYNASQSFFYSGCCCCGAGSSACGGAALYRRPDRRKVGLPVPCYWPDCSPAQKARVSAIGGRQAAGCRSCRPGHDNACRN